MGDSYPDFVRSALPIATTSHLSAQSIAFDAVGRSAILADRDFADGQYHDKGQPAERTRHRADDRAYYVPVRRKYA